MSAAKAVLIGAGCLYAVFVYSNYKKLQAYNKAAENNQSELKEMLDSFNWGTFENARPL